MVMHSFFVVYGAYTRQQSYCVIGCDSKKGSALATNHLIRDAKKHKILYLGLTDNFEGKQRINGYLDALENQWGRHFRATDPAL